MKKHIFLVAGLATLIILGFIGGCSDVNTGRRIPPNLPTRGPRYEYSHVYLRELFFANPDQLINTLNVEGSQYLRYLWINKAKGDQASSNEIDYKMIKSDPDLHIITLPKPIDLTDAYLIALTLKDRKYRYFILEKTFSYMNTGDGLKNLNTSFSSPDASSISLLRQGTRMYMALAPFF